MREAEFEQLYEEHAQPLFGFLVYRTGNRALAEDVMAETFEKAYRGRGSFDLRRGNQKTWLYAIALNALRDHARRHAAEARAYERATVTVPGGDFGGFDAIDDRDRLGRALQSLTSEEREAVALRFGAELTVPEIATLSGEKLSTAEGRVYRALRKLRQRLEE